MVRALATCKIIACANVLLCHLRKLSGRDRLQTEKGGFSRFPLLQTHQPDVYKLMVEMSSETFLMQSWTHKLSSEGHRDALHMRVKQGSSFATLWEAQQARQIAGFCRVICFGGIFVRERERCSWHCNLQGDVVHGLCKRQSGGCEELGAELRFITSLKNLWVLPGSKIAHTWSQQRFRILVVCVILCTV